MNQFVLAAEVIERGAMRYTPAGLPALDLTLKSESSVVQNGQPRKVALEIKAVVVGTMAAAVGAMGLGSSATFSGFIAPARTGKSLQFHITEIH